MGFAKLCCCCMRLECTLCFGKHPMFGTQKAPAAAQYILGRLRGLSASCLAYARYLFNAAAMLPTLSVIQAM